MLMLSPQFSKLYIFFKVLGVKYFSSRNLVFYLVHFTHSDSVGLHSSISPHPQN